MSERERSPRRHSRAPRSLPPQRRALLSRGEAGALSGCPEDGCAYGGGGRLSSPSSPTSSLTVQLYLRHPRGGAGGERGGGEGECVSPNPPCPPGSRPAVAPLPPGGPTALAPCARSPSPLPPPAHSLYPHIDGQRGLYYYYFNPISLRAGGFYQQVWAGSPSPQRSMLSALRHAGREPEPSRAGRGWGGILTLAPS